MNRLLEGILAMAAALAFAQPTLAAEDWPQRPLRIVVPYATGGNTDLVARLTAQRLQEVLGQSVIVENRPGGAGVIAVSFVAKARPDGYTLLMSSSGPHTVLPNLKADLPYQPLKDLVPISNVSTNALVLFVHPSVPVKNYRELIDLARSQPGRLNLGSGGNASTSHLAGEMLKSMEGLRMTHVPFNGGAPLMAAMMSGDVQVAFNNIADVLPYIRDGRLRAIAVTSAARQALAPDIPTVAESGLPGYEAGPWNGLVEPAGTPAFIVQRLAAEVQKIVRDPAFRESLLKVGSEPIGDTPEQFRAFIERDLARWGKVVRDAGIKLD